MLTIRINVVQLVGDRHVAMTTLGGIQLRGKVASGANAASGAVRNLLWKLAGQDGDDNAEVALELALEGLDINEQLALPDGSGDD